MKTSVRTELVEVQGFRGTHYFWEILSMVNRYLPLYDVPVSKQKPLVSAIRALIAGGFVIGAGVAPAQAEFPVPTAPVQLTPTPVDIAISGQAAGQAAVSVVGNAMTIKQVTDKATLDWKSFNIGVNNSVHFDQPSANAVALNNIHQNDASKILGSLTANGQVYLVNQNGFLFGKDSQVNVNSLVASTLGISDANFQAGITKVFDLNKNSSDYLNKAAALKGNGEIYLKNANGSFLLDQNGQKVKVQIFVEKGAHIKTNAPGGRVIIAAPSITNEGTIETPDGQTILAAAKDKVYLQEAGTDSDIRGLLVEVGTGGDVNNVGKVLAERGNASLIGFAVNQKGIASATTSVQLNGSVRLLAREGIQNPAQTGGSLKYKNTLRTDGTRATVNLTAGSLTSVDLDSDKSATAIDAQAQKRSKIEISGHKIVLGNQSTVQAHAGDVTINAVDDVPGKHDARIYLEEGSKVDVSGVKNVQLAVDRNILNVELRKNELRDSPLQKDGVLYGKTVAVDIRNTDLTYVDGKLTSAAIPIADVKGAVDRIARNIDERSTEGGSINLNSSGDVIAKAGSSLDFSGGSVAYKAGTVNNTKLGANGQVYDIATADPNRKYDKVITQAHYDPGYVEGKAGGDLNITAYEAVLDGQLQGQTIAGALQRLPEDRAAGSSLNIDLSNLEVYSKQDVVFDQNAAAKILTVDDKLARRNGGAPGQPPVALSINTGMLRNSRVGNVNIKTSGSVAITKNTVLNLPALGRLSLSAQNFDIQGAIVTPSGTVDLQPIRLQNILQPSGITLGASALIDVSGLWVNDLLDVRQGRGLAPVNIKGGTVNLAAEQRDLILAQGSRIDASGGAWKQSNAKVTAGDGGSITLAAESHDPQVKPGSLLLNGDLQAWGLQQGGTLALSANEVVIGPVSAAPIHAGSTLQPLVLSTDFFQRGGFFSYDITSNYYGLKVADNVTLQPLQLNRQLTANATTTSGGSLLAVSKAVTLPGYLRNPVNLKLSFADLAGQNTQEVLSVGKGTLIQTDTLGKVELNSDTSIIVDGTIKTPAGKITLKINTPQAVTGFLPSQGIWLGAESKLLAQGVFDKQFSTNGLKIGDVLSGGAVDLTAKRGYIVTRTGSLIDVSGTTEKLDFLESGIVSKGLQRVVRDIASDAGSINFTAGEGILADGGFNAKAGGIGAAGGTFSATLDRNLRDKPDYLLTNTTKFPDDINVSQPYRIEVSTDNSNVVPDALSQGGNIDANSFSGRALLKSSRINAAGFDSLLLNTDVVTVNGQYTSGVVFKGDVQLNAGRQIVIDSPSLQTNNGHVTLNTAYAALGSTQTQTNANIAPTATGGTGQLDVNAQAIELLGGLGFNGFNKVNLNSAGDLRLRGILNSTAKTFRGVLNLNGDLTIKANQLYPATLTDYTINVTGSGNESVTFLNSGNAASPIYSAGGKLTVNAPNIYQQGTVKVPFGALFLNASKNLQLTSGSVTSVSGAGLTVPFGRGSGGTTWLYPLDNVGNSNIVINTPPEKRLELTGKDVDLQAGATIDLSGGGDLYAYEFITGSGGSNDVLDPTAPGYSQNFAVLPGFSNLLAPYDPLESPSSGLAIGNSVFLNAGGGLAAGWYTLLPAHYALLPGAYLITPKAGTQDQYQTTTDLAGTAIVAGRFGVAGTGIQNARSQGFAVELGTIARSRSEYANYTANDFFSKQAINEGTVQPQLPQDAGSLAINAKTSLALTAKLIANPAGQGFGGEVDISADNLRILGRREDLAGVATGTVGLLVDDLNQLNAPSLLLGGKRTKDAKGQRITVSTDNVKVDGNVGLKGQEILLAGINQVTLASGAVVESNGKSNTAGGTLLVDNKNGGSDSALLRVFSGGQVDVVRDKTITGNGGILTVESGARIKADGSTLLDSSKNTVFDGVIDMQGGSLALNSSRISVGNAPANTPGLVLANTNFNLDDLRLNSTHDFDIYGSVNLNSKQVSISAAAINGFNNAGETSFISGDLIKLSNQGATAERSGTGTGALVFNAREIQLGSGQYAINGFNNVSFNASEGINGVGQIIDPLTGNSSIAAPGSLKIGGDIALNAGYFSGGNGATTSIDATGHNVSLTSPAGIPANRNIGLGVRWSVTGDSISSNARFDLPSGILELTALTGDLNLTNGSNIDLSGRVVTFANTYKASAAGSLSLTASQGNVNQDVGAAINLAGAKIATNAAGATQQVSDAGSLAVKASNGQFNWNGTIDAKGVTATAADLRQGRFLLDVNNFGAGGFSALNNKLATAGFTEQLTLQQRNGDVTIAAADNVKAHEFELIADQGAVTIDGQIDASGAKAGEVSIYGRNGIALGSTGKIYANATAAGNDGGKVTLDTVHRDDTGNGLLNLAANGGLINVAGGASGSGGALHLRTGRDNTNDSAFTAINTTVQGANPLRTALELTRVYDNQTAIDATNISAWKNDTQNFMDARPVLTNNSGAEIEILPGIEVRSDGDLALNERWDFMDGSWSFANASWDSTWRYADAAGNKSLPGFLTLTAVGNLKINASLTDAFANAPIPGQDITDESGELIYLHNDLIQPGRSWSYSFNAGNNVELAHSSVVDQSQVMVRTGTGDIEIAAGGDIRFLKDTSNAQAAAAVYTMGAPAIYTRGQLLAGVIPGAPTRLNGESDEQYLGRLGSTQLNALLRYGYFDEMRVGLDYLYAEYPTQGGNIGLTAAGNIQGVQTGQQISDWLVRGGFWNDGRTDNRPTAWGIDVSGDVGQGGLTLDANGNSSHIRYFNQNVGALGGGNVNIQASGNVHDLSVMLPTTGKPFGVMNDVVNSSWSANGAVVNGGGDLQVLAGNDIIGGEYYVGLGTGTLVAGGSIAKGNIPNSNSKVGVILDVGDATFNVQARKDLYLATAMNPTMTEQSVLPDKGSQFDARFFSYGLDSGVNLISTSGNVVLDNDFDAIKTLKSIANSAQGKFEYLVYPATLQAAALSGDIRINNSMTLFPSFNGDLSLLANGNIGTDTTAGNNQLYINMSDADPARLPTAVKPAAEVEGSIAASKYLARELLNPASLQIQLHATTPVHQGDQTLPLIQAKNGSIAFPTNLLATFYLPQASSFIAGKDISNLNILAQNLAVNDVTLIKAGGNIDFATDRDANGKIITATSDDQYFKLGGPGQLQVLAGGDISLGGSDGIQTIGNLFNQALANNGASISVLAGLSDKVDYAGFINKYQTVYSTQLQGLANLSEDEQRQHLSTLLTVLFQEIKQSAAAAAAAPESQRTALYKRGFDAIQALFPGDNYAGDLSLVFSQIKTLAGGDLNLAVPGGKVDVGLAGKQGGVSKEAGQLGIVVQQQGDLNILAEGNINVNQSRIFTMGGGDIAAWSSKGDIDAGKGAKSAISAPKPVTTIDSNGNIKTVFPPIFSGSGIQAIGGGDVTLAAPEGVVDAGEAGISGGNITIAATAVIGASNIQSSGATTGVPVTVSAPVTVAGADSAAASAAKTATQSNDEDDDNTNDKDEKDKKTTVSILSADVVGFGDCSVGDVKDAKAGCGGGV